MNCPRCGLNLAGFQGNACPRCGLSLPPQGPRPGYGPPPQPPRSAPSSGYGGNQNGGQYGGQYGGGQQSGGQFGGGYGDERYGTRYPDEPPGDGGWGQPPAGRGFNEPAGPSRSRYTEPAGPSRPLYGEPAGPSRPLGGSQPSYYGPNSGRANFGDVPGRDPGDFMGPGGPSRPFGEMPLGGPVAPPRAAKKSANRVRAIVSVVAGLVLVAAIAGGFALLDRPSDSYPLTSSANGWTSDSSCVFKSDGYHSTSTEICFAPSNAVGDGTITVQAKAATLSTGGGYGVVFRHASKGNYYVFYVTSDGHWGCDKVVGGNDTTLTSGKDKAIQTGTGAANTLKIQLAGANLTFYVNGTQVGTSSDTTFAKGDTGLVGGDGDDIVFTNFAITR